MNLGLRHGSEFIIDATQMRRQLLGSDACESLLRKLCKVNVESMVKCLNQRTRIP